MIYTLALKNLPFKPLKSQIIYVESSYDERVNKYIQDNLEHLCAYCSVRDFQFCYLPKMQELQAIDDETLLYNAPYANPNDLPKPIGSDFLLNFMSNPGNKELIPPSLIYISKKTKEKPAKGEVLFRAVSVTDQDEFPTIEDIFDLRLKEIVQELFVGVEEPVCEERISDIRFSISDDEKIDEKSEGDASFSFEERKSPNFSILKENKKPIGSEEKPKSRTGLGKIWFDMEKMCSDEPTPPKSADETFDEESKKIAEDIKKRAKRLEKKGIDLLRLFQYLAQSEPLSRLHITKDFRIFLPDYNNKEIEMTPLPKAVFLLFLKHPEGIPFKYLPDFKEELKEIYSKLKAKALSESEIRSIETVTDPFDNSINEKCARIREAFIKQFKKHLAENYFVTGERGEPKKITLPRNLVVWDE